MRVVPRGIVLIETKHRTLVAYWSFWMGTFLRRHGTKGWHAKVGHLAVAWMET